MSWGIDPELQEMFYGELDERAARLSEGAAELQAGPVPSDRAGAMMREAHTIKGTGRVLGFEAVAHVGEVLEQLWRGVQSGDIQINGDATAALVRVTASLSPAGRGDPGSGTPELVATFNAFVESIPIEAAPLAPATTPAEEGEVVAPEAPASAEPVDEPSVLQDEPVPDDADAGNRDESVPEAAPGFDVRLEPEAEADGASQDLADESTARPVADAEATPSVEEIADVGAVPPSEGEPEAQVSEPSIAVSLDHGTVEVGEPAAHEPVEQPVAQAVEAEAQPSVGPAAAEPVEAVVEAPIEEPVAEPAEVPEITLEAQPAIGAEPRAEPPPSPPPTDVGGEGTGAEVGGEGMQHYRVDLAGLMGAVEHWGRTEAVPVNAGRLYEMINDVAALRQEAHSALGRARGDGAEVSDAIARLQARADALQSESLGLAAVPLTGLTSQLPQLIAYLAKKLNRGVAFQIAGDEDIAVDRQVMDAIGDPLRQIVVNAIHHGIEPRIDRRNAGKPDDGTVTVQFSLKRGALVVVVSDDGAGVDWDKVHSVAAAEGRLDSEALGDPERLHALLFETGFTTGSDAEFGGGGKGLSTVETIVESLFGRVTLETEPGAGTTVTITVPAFRALQSVLLVIAGGMEWGIPAAAVDEVVPLAEVKVERDGTRRWITRNDRQLPVASFAEVVGLEEGGRDDAYAVVVDHRLGSAAFTVSAITGTRELAVKEMGRIVSGPRHILGAAFLSGDMLLVVDPGRLVERTQREPGKGRPSARVMVVDDSRGARAVVSGALASSGFLTSVAGSVAEALDLLDEAPVDALVVDFSMPQADGVALVEEVRRRGIQVPIIMLSGVANQEDQERARLAGADAFFEKADFREGTLADALWKMLDD